MTNNSKHAGLTRAQAHEQLLRGGYNELASSKKTSRAGLFLEQFKDVLTLTLIGATLISFFLGEVSDGVAILVILLINGILGFVQEYKTEKSLEALAELSAPMSNVMRDGEQIKIPSREVVVGDIAVLEAGDRVCADCRMVEGTNVEVNESILTGESVAVEKSLQGDNQLYMGTSLTVGRCLAEVTAIGMATRMGQIAHMLKTTGGSVTPLKRTLNKIGKELVLICFGVCVLIFVAGIFHGQTVYDMFFAAVSLAVAAIPEGLPAVVTVALAIGVERMLKRNALVRKLPAVETLGSTNVICTDKTGTLTENKMTVLEVWCGGRTVEVSGNGYQLEGNFTINNMPVSPAADDTLSRLLLCGYLCNNTIYRKGELTGDPTEIALYVAAKKAGISNDYPVDFERLAEQPFDSARKRMSVVCKNSKGEIWVFVKGAPDSVLPRCTKKIMSGSAVDFSQQSDARNANDRMTAKALRVLGFACKRIEGDWRGYTCEQLESGLTFLGLQGMMDPPRAEVKGAIAACYAAGIEPVMITGDHKNTARAIALDLGFKHRKEPMEGAEIAALTDDALADAVVGVNVFARVSPLDKLRIVRAFKRRKNIVAMTGDGVNDAPSLKEADIGIAMGECGTDVAKEAADMVLLDDNFSTIVAAVEEGRMIFDNVRKFIRYLLACNLGEILMMGAAAFLGMPLPLIPIQILWLNLVTDGLPALALGIDPPDGDIMRRTPRKSDESIFSHGLGGGIAASGLIIGASALVAFAVARIMSGDLAVARTVAFATLIFAELIFSFECKSEYKSLLHIRLMDNPSLVAAVVGSFLLTLAVIYFPPLAGVFGTVPIGAKLWLPVLGLGLAEPLLNTLLLGRGKEKKYLIR